MNDENKIFLDVPREIVHDKSDEIFCSDNGAEFVWLDLSEALSLDGYGCYFPSWLIEKHLEYCTLTIEREYHSARDEKMHQNIFKAEHKVKVAGKRFKRFAYSPEELVSLLQYYSEKIEKTKAAEKNKILAEVTESTGKFGSVTFYAVGYINEKIFYSDEIRAFRQQHNLEERQGGKKISAKSFRLIAKGLNDTDAHEARLLAQAKMIAESELSELQKENFKLPFPFEHIGWQREKTEYISDFSYHVMIDHEIHHETITGYPDELKKMQSKIQAAIQDAIVFLEDKIHEIDEKLMQFGKLS